MERLVQQAGRQPDSATALYHFNASLYLLRVLKGSTAEGCVRETQEKQKASTDPSPVPTGPQAASCLDLNLVTRVYSSALSSFLTKRNSPLTVPMFLSLFSRHPVSVGACPAYSGSLLSPACTSQPVSLPTRFSVRAFSPSWSSMSQAQCGPAIR